MTQKKLTNPKNYKIKKQVLSLTKKIPKGKVTTYKIITEKIGTKAYRAVGTILKDNDKPILIPCHRVILSSGHIGSYKGLKDNPGKIKLLKKEGINIKGTKVCNLKRYIHTFKL